MGLMKRNVSSAEGAGMSLVRAKFVRVAVSRKMAVICFMLLLAGVGLLGRSMRPTALAHGGFSQEEFTGIVQAVRRDIWREAFPDSSWLTIKGAPRALWAVATARISEVTPIDRNLARVTGRFRFKTMSAGYVHIGWDLWTLKKEGTKWTVRRKSLTPQGSPRQAAAWDGGVGFSEVMSNTSRLSYDAGP